MTPPLPTKPIFLCNPQGNSIIQVLIAMGVMSILNLSIITVMNNQTKNHSEFNIKTSILALRQNIAATVGHHSAWKKTYLSNKAVMGCSSVSQTYCNPLQPETRASLRLLDSTGTVVIDTSPTAGFTAFGEPCNQYSAVGNDACPVKVELLWRAACQLNTCTPALTNANEQKYEEFVSLRFTYSPGKGRQFPFNSRNYNIVEQNRLQLTDNISPAIACGEAGKIFVGPGKVINSYPSDLQGCVTYNAFFGAKGDPGPPGPAGPPGVCL